MSKYIVKKASTGVGVVYKKIPNGLQVMTPNALRLALNKLQAQVDEQEKRMNSYAMVGRKRLHDRIEDLESQVAELQAQVDEKYLMDEYWKLQAQVDGVIEILENTEELNPSNYDHELVCQMNNSFVEMWNFLHPKAAIKGDTNDND